MSFCRSILNGVTRILDINTDTGVTEMNVTKYTGASVKHTQKIEMVEISP